MLPMQRITRLPLLLVAVLNRLGPDHDEYHLCELALASLNKVCLLPASWILHLMFCFLNFQISLYKWVFQL